MTAGGLSDAGARAPAAWGQKGPGVARPMRRISGAKAFEHALPRVTVERPGTWLDDTAAGLLVVEIIIRKGGRHRSVFPGR